MLNSENIFLIGLMGAGKSTIGRQLAARTGKQFMDSDKEIEQRTGATIELIFEIEGEQGFRERESRVIEELTENSGIVLATGGGAVLSADNREWLKQRGTVVYLNTSPEVLHARTANDQNRPLLQTGDKYGRLIELLAERDPLYRRTADLIVDTEGLSARQIVGKICKSLKLKCVN